MRPLPPLTPTALSLTQALSQALTLTLALALVLAPHTVFAAASSPTPTPGVTLTDTLRQAFAYSPQLRQSQEIRQQAVHEVRRAEASYYPTIGIWGGGGIMQSDDVSTRARDQENDVVGTGTAGLQLSQTLWQGGATAASVRSRTAQLDVRTWQLMDNATSLALGAITAHADVLRRQRLLELATVNVREHKSILHVLLTRHSQGLSSAGDVEQVRGRVARAEASRIQHRTGLDAAMANYTRLTGQPVAARLAAVQPPSQIWPSVDNIRDACVRQNPRIQADLAVIQSTLADRDAASSRFAPRLSLDAGPAYSDWGRRGTNYQWTWNAMLNMSWAIYSGGADEAGFKAAAARAREARKVLHVTMDMLDEEIQITFSRTRNAREQTDYYAQARKAGRAARDNFYTQFQAGQKDLLNVLDAESEYYFAASEECVNATDAVLGQYRLLALAGSLLETMGVEAASLKTGPADATDQGARWNFFPTSHVDKDAATQDSTLRKPK